MVDRRLLFIIKSNEGSILEDLFASFAEPTKEKPAKKPAVRNLDIHAALKAVDTNDGDWYKNQTAEAKKEFATPVFLRWASTIDNRNSDEIAYMLCSINESVNVHMWHIWEHPELTFRLAASCGLGWKRRGAWIKGPERKTKTNKLYAFMVKFYPDANDTEINLVLKKHTKESFSEFVYTETGSPDDECKEMTKAFNKL